MKTSNFIIKSSVVIVSFAISIVAATQSEWLWSAFFMIDVIDRCSSLTDELIVCKANTTFKEED